MSFIREIAVIKAGTESLVQDAKDENGRFLRHDVFTEIGRQVVELNSRDIGVLLVSSGARKSGEVASGERRESGDNARKLRRYNEGWGLISSEWKGAFGGGVDLLMSKSQIENKSSRSARTLCRLIASDGVVIVNEIAPSSAGDVYINNDILAANLARGMAEASAIRGLVLATTTNGILRSMSDSASNLYEVTDLTQLDGLIVSHSSANSEGGMLSKIEAARIVATTQIDTFITDASKHDAILDCLQGRVGTKISHTAFST
jgi:glutamate 5-kinase